MRLRWLAAGIAIGLLSTALASSPVPAQAAPAPELNPLLSLTGDCSAGKLDPIPDPGCPYSPFPDGPTGRFNGPTAIAVDPYGDVYVLNSDNGSFGQKRVDVFDDEGRFVTEFSIDAAWRIAVDSEGNLYRYSRMFNDPILRYTPSKYAPEAGEIEYANPPTVLPIKTSSGSLAIDPSNDHLFVVEGGAITEYSAAATGNEPLDTFSPEALGGNQGGLAVDGQRRRLYVTYCKNQTFGCEVAVLVLDADPPHSVLGELDGSNTPAGAFQATLFSRLSIGVDEESGELHIGDFEDAQRLYQFDASYAYLSEVNQPQFTAFGVIAVSNGERLGGDAFNRHHVFATTNDTNRVLAFAAGAAPPEVTGVSATSITETEATLQAVIAPKGVDTEYTVQYATQAAIDSEGFGAAAVAAEGTVPGASAQARLSVPVAGLTPGTAYRFRVLAESESGPAEPVGEASFSSYDDSRAAGSCANGALRGGPSAALPDCRAYELVTPPETTGRAPLGVVDVGVPVVQASPTGDAVSFRIEGGSLPGTAGGGSFAGDPYLATRTSSGWSTALAGPSGVEVAVLDPESVSPDQGYSFWGAKLEGSLVVGGLLSTYLQYPDGHPEPIGRGSLGTDFRARGLMIAEDGAHVVFQTTNSNNWVALRLEPDAPPDGIEAIYDRTIDPATGAEQTHTVSLLPGEETPVAGAGYVGASKDGEGIAFAIGKKLYLRVGNETTYEVGENVTFAGVSQGGERIFYLQGGDLKALDTTGGPPGEVIEFSTSGDVTPVNVAAGGARAYFVSPSVLGGVNPQGDSAQLDEQNLYLSEEGQIRFVATVTDRDVEGEGGGDGLGLWTAAQPGQIAADPSRLTPDGSVLLFQSRADLTGFDPQGSAQVFRYDSVAQRLHCLSCIPTGMPTGGRAELLHWRLNADDRSPLRRSGFVPNLTPDGTRVFFESTEALVSTDTDGFRDVYEWEEAGIGSCEEPGGCLHLISLGQSSADSYLYAQSEDGDDVFISSPDRLTPEDPSHTYSIYDARVNGGFAIAEPAGECLGEACQPAVRAPDAVSPESALSRGPGNVRPPAKARRRCPKGKRKVRVRRGRARGKVRCARKRRKAHRRKHRRAQAHGKAVSR